MAPALLRAGELFETNPEDIASPSAEKTFDRVKKPRRSIHMQDYSQPNRGKACLDVMIG
jgi:hypothetical protein